MLVHRLQRWPNIKPMFRVYIHNQSLAINYWLLRAFIGHWSQIHLFTGVSVIHTFQILITFLSGGSVLQCQITTKIHLSCELSTIIFPTSEMLSFNLVHNTCTNVTFCGWVTP